MVRTLTSCYRLNEIFAFLTYRLFTSKEKSECFKIQRHFANFRMLSETSFQQFNKTEEMIWSANPCAVRVPKLQLCFRPGTRRHSISSQNYVGVPNSSQLTQYLTILFFLSFYISEISLVTINCKLLWFHFSFSNFTILFILMFITLL